MENRCKVYTNEFFPKKNKKKKHYKSLVTVGIGGNIGDVCKRLKRLYMYFDHRADLHVVQTSCILKNPPFGYKKQNDFYNAVMLVQTSKPPRDFLKCMLHTEKAFGRKRSFANAPRTLDLDIVFYENIVYNHKKLKIPHEDWHNRDSVILPLIDLKDRVWK